MDISIYDNYSIKHTCTYSYESFDYDDLQTKTETEMLEMDGGKFLSNFIADSIKRPYFSSISFGDNLVHIEIFDPMTGHSEEHTYELEEIN